MKRTWFSKIGRLKGVGIAGGVVEAGRIMNSITEETMWCVVRDISGGGVVEAERIMNRKVVHKYLFSTCILIVFKMDFPLYLKWSADKRRQHETQ